MKSLLRKILPHRIVFFLHILNLLITPKTSKETLRGLLWKIKNKSMGFWLVFFPFYFPYIILHFIAFFTCRKDKMIFVTGADSSHYKSLCRFLTSFFKYEPNTKVIVYDLGLTEAENCNLRNSFPLAEIRIFDYSKYPAYFNIKKYAKGNYAWKPAIIYNVFNEFKCNICWMDAGNIILRPLYLLRKEVKKSGFYSPFSGPNIAKWTHPATLRFLNVSKELLKKRNLSGGCITISYQNPKIRNFITKWHKYTFIKECIAPKGSSLANHRYDQAMLTILAYQLNVFHHMPVEEYYGIKFHQDIG